MLSLTRRAIVSLIGLAPVAVPRLAAEAPSLLSVAEPLNALAAGGGPSPGPPSSSANLPAILAKQIQHLKDQGEREAYIVSTLRTDGLDHDIACLKSTSRAWKVAKQAQRLREDAELLTRLNRALWG